MYPRQPDSVPADRPRVLVIQLGGELECAMTVGWIEALRPTADIEIVGRIEYSEILGALPQPTCYHPITANPLDLFRTRLQLKDRDFDRVLCLNNKLACRILATVCIAEKRIQTQIGPPTLPSEIDAVLAVIFARLGVAAPNRNSTLTLSTRTQNIADETLRGFGFDKEQQPQMLAPQTGTESALSSWSSKSIRYDSTLPVILLPAGDEIEFIGALVGKAFLIPTSDLSFRAALIQRSCQLLSNDPPSIELAKLMGTPVTNLRAAAV